MIDSGVLLADLKRELKMLEADLRERVEDGSSSWGARLREEYQRAQAKERTGLSWIDWRNGEVAQAGVAWIIATVFIRFSEDNHLLVGATNDGRAVSQPWIAAPGDGLERAVENEAAFYAAAPTMTSRDWLQEAFGTLADLPAGGPLVDRGHSAVWHSEISATASDGLLAFFRRTTPDGALVHDFSDADLDTRFLGDLYQDLSDHAKKTYALLQTPVFVEQFILDLTLTPAVEEFGLTGLKLIDPACGSGHFLLGAFDRLMAEWGATAPGLDRGDRAQRALDSIHGVDLNPFAIAIARFRLTVAAIKAAGIPSLVAAPAFRYHLAIGDSLLGGYSPESKLDMGDGEYFAYQAEDLQEHANILAPGQYHVVVANPPYIQPQDAALRDTYRALYSTCHGKYALSVPFMELLFRLAQQTDAASSAGYVGQITSNSFMTREFGKRLVKGFLSGDYTGTEPKHVDLTHVIDVSRAYIPGHNSEGTPTVILAGRPRRPIATTVRSALGVRAESGQPTIAAEGLVWREIVGHIDQPGYFGAFVSIVDMPREVFATFPWSLTGGLAANVKRDIDSACVTRLEDEIVEVGVSVVTGENEPYEVPTHFTGTTKPLVLGVRVRDYEARGPLHLWPYSDLLQPAADSSILRWMWPFRVVLRSTLYFGKTPLERGREWYEYAFVGESKYRVALSITYAELATHNHFVMDRGGKVFNQKAPVIKLPADSGESAHYDLLGVLNSSVICFWLKQSAHDRGTGQEPWEWRYEFTSRPIRSIPLPAERARDLARKLDELACARENVSPHNVLSPGMGIPLAEARTEWRSVSDQMTALQEELDWRMYVAFGLCSSDLLPPNDAGSVGIEPNARAFEIRLAREVSAGLTKTAWFKRHKRALVTELPTTWPDWYADLVKRRLAAIDEIPALRLLEQPQYKRRWAGDGWDDLLADAVRVALLDSLEARECWLDGYGRPLVRSVAQIADDLRHDQRVRELFVLLTGSQDFDLMVEVGKLLAGAAVPTFAPLRCKPAGIEKFRAWQYTWDLQRAEDRGETVDVPIPPKYIKTDFLKDEYWSARGKLDVPKERFLSFPGSRLPDDPTELYGWAGWDYAERGQAIARLANDLSRAGAPEEQVVPVVGALIELQPWLDQWHSDIDTQFGVSPASAISGITNGLLGRLGLGADTVVAWRPAPATRGKKKL